MSNKHKDYGTYYGKLVPFNKVPEDFKYSTNLTSDETFKFIKKLHNCKVLEIFFDIDEYEDYSDTLFIKVDDNTDMNKLLVLLCSMRADEFHETSPNCFRMWFD